MEKERYEKDDGQKGSPARRSGQMSARGDSQRPGAELQGLFALEASWQHRTSVLVAGLSWHWHLDQKLKQVQRQRAPNQQLRMYSVCLCSH